MTSGNEMTMKANRAADVASQYFAYIAVLSVGVMIAVVTMYYSAQTAITWIDAATFPERNPTANFRTLPAEQDNGAAVSNTFAMLPAAAPLRMKNEVISSNF